MIESTGMQMRHLITFFHRKLLGLGPIRLRPGQELVDLKRGLSNSFYEAEIFELGEDQYVKWSAGDLIFKLLFLFMSAVFHFVIIAFLFNFLIDFASAAIMLVGLFLLFLMARIFIVSYRPTLKGFL